MEARQMISFNVDFIIFDVYRNSMYTTLLLIHGHALCKNKKGKRNTLLTFKK